MKVIKRNGSEVEFDKNKIIVAITKANEANVFHELTENQISEAADYIQYKCERLNRAASVEEIQDMVENQIMAHGAFEVAKEYVRYRYQRSLVRKANTTDDRVLSLIECNNEEVKQENSNKNPIVNSVQRDYIAGEVSRDLSVRLLLPKEIVDADKEGIIHFHDTDYYAQHMHNCDLVNLEDMLQNGTVISETMIEKPHSFSTACNIATQIIAQVASNQYGGQSISLAHLAPFVQISREKIRKSVEEEVVLLGIDATEEVKSKIVEKRLLEEIKKGVQTIQYQVITLMTTNGQAPFLTVFMYLNEAKNESEKRDLALIIEETLKQRITGVKNEAGVWITPAFPKLIYVLEEDNIKEGTPYFYLTKLAAKCSAKRLVPDYISEKKMKELKEDIDSRLASLTERIYSEAGYEFKINSTLQLSKLLFDERGLPPGKKTQRGYSTDTATLEGLRSTGDPIVEDLLQYRLLSKLKSTYVDVLPTLMDKEGRIHTTFLQTGTATGRLSSRNPNLQNIPVRNDEGRLIRSAFVPGEGNIFISADYSQIELVVLAWLAEDQGLRNAFISGEDVHRYTAALIYDKEVSLVTPQERRVAKTINFGIMYGMSAFRLSGELGITRREAADFIEKYFQRYSGVKSFVEKTVKKAAEEGFVRTYWGHVRDIPGISSRNATERAAAERTAVNTVIQGTAAEIMKKAMLDIGKELDEKKYGTRLLLQVHDELIFQVPLSEADEVEKMIKEKMEGAVSLPIPLKASVERGRCWGDMH